MIIKNKSELNEYQKTVDIATNILFELKKITKSGIYPIEIDKAANKLCAKYNVIPAFKGVGSKKNKYMYSTCISINDVVVHGVPSSTRKLKEGDIVNVDFGIIKNGYVTDHCFTKGLEPLTYEARKLINIGKKAVQKGVYKAIVGNKTGDIGHEIFSIVQSSGYDVVKQFTGHGIGKSLHEKPNISAFGNKGEGIKLKKGMVLCIEAQIVQGSDEVYFDNDGWTAKTVDKKLSVMFEYMIIVQKNKPYILTKTMDW